MIWFLIIIELAEFFSNLGHSFIVIILNKVRIIVVVFIVLIQITDTLFIVKFSNFFPQQKSTNVSLDFDKLV